MSALGLMIAAPAWGQLGKSADRNADVVRSARSAPAKGRIVRGCCIAADLLYLEATPIDDATIEIDGYADEAVWEDAEIATGFVQYQPQEGAGASERTEARVVYGSDALFVFMRAFDRSPGEIVGQLTRRDQTSHSDVLGVVVDSYFDRRTGFHFAVNPEGVKHDVYRFDDTEEDSGWDAVWDVSVRRDAEGWSAEFRIPYSQLRFSDAEEQTWGINFFREIARRQELSVWAPTTRSDGGIVSRFGELRGLRGLSAPNRLEVLPYSVVALERAPGDAANPYYAQNATFGSGGVDLKYGVTSNLTLDVTVNPDFGQVEADPAQVNLTAFETFLPERRPFFLEGANIFNFGIALGDGDGANESLFYSRRVGRAPQGRASAAGGYSDVDDQTTILGAWKLSGKTAGGWSIGAMHAMTAQEDADITPTSGAPYSEAVEPLSHYGVLRVQKDFREGRSAIGLVGTGISRDGSITEALALRSSALTGGIDLRHRFAGDTWQVAGYVLGSRVAGSPTAMARTQYAPARYFQRPDADHLDFDPDRTSLAGLSANVALMKFAGGSWRIGTGAQARTPGFEVNDVGFQKNADYLVHWGWLGYQQSREQGPFRNWSLNFNGWNVWDFGGTDIGTGANVNLNGQFKNFWRAHLGVNQEFQAYSSGMLRGGPMMIREGRTNFWGGFGTDARKSVQFNLSSFGNVRPESSSYAVGLSPSLRVRPSGRASVTVGSFVNRNENDSQWVVRLDTDRSHYVFGRIEQTTVGLTARADLAFSPTLTLQLYAQPFVSAGSYSAFKEVADSRAETYDGRFRALDVRAEGGRYYNDLDADGSEESWGDPDFNFKQFRSNAVLRWEYRPGSTLFLVWSQGRDHFAPLGDFDMRGDMGDLFSVQPDNVFMVKVSYWMSR